MSALFPVLRTVDVVARDAGGAIGLGPLDKEGGIVGRRWRGKDGAGVDIRPCPSFPIKKNQGASTENLMIYSAPHK